MAERRKQNVIVPTFEKAAHFAYKEHSKVWENKKHIAQRINILSHYVFSLMRERRVDQIDAPDVQKVFSPIWLSKPETARRVKQRMRTVFNWAKAVGFRSGKKSMDSVRKELSRQPNNKSHNKALPYDQVPGFINQLSGIKKDVTAHGFRSSFRDGASETTHFSREFMKWPPPIQSKTRHMTWIDDVSICNQNRSLLSFLRPIGLM